MARSRLPEDDDDEHSDDASVAGPRSRIALDRDRTIDGRMFGVTNEAGDLVLVYRFRDAIRLA